MIRLTDCGTTGLNSDPVDLDETEISSLSADPVRPGADKTVVTMKNGTWFLVRESPDAIKELMAQAAK